MVSRQTVHMYVPWVKHFPCSSKCYKHTRDSRGTALVMRNSDTSNSGLEHDKGNVCSLHVVMSSATLPPIL